MLGAASQRIDSEALKLFDRKVVCFYPHIDEAGRSAASAWAEQLRDAGATVLAFDLSGCVKIDGSAGKDLNDLTCINPDCFEQERKFWEVLP